MMKEWIQVTRLGRHSERCRRNLREYLCRCCVEEVKIFACVIGNLLYHRFWGIVLEYWLCVVIRFCLRHESVACINLGVGPNSVLVQHSPVPYTLHFDLPLFCIQSLRCDLRVSWTQEASPRRKRRVAVNQVWQDRVILIIQVSDFVLGVYESLRSDLNWARSIFYKDGT